MIFGLCVKVTGLALACILLTCQSLRILEQTFSTIQSGLLLIFFTIGSISEWRKN